MLGDHLVEDTPEDISIDPSRAARKTSRNAGSEFRQQGTSGEAFS